ncbi:hypothetical protein [Cryptosporangium phraense]|uniref:Uncharacterized protein n=1 Tax=Cryptosporangium phraense TaxID=2593070 RepID=A0A545AHV0_9ACTN|nr:hypothetical protein [Cryptosporangium phraense]TQS40265.1 hypothetical protein FL583_35700 [Cryptosporangium phraense]
MTDESPAPVERIHRTPVQYLLLVLARPSVWLIWLGGTLAGLGLLELGVPYWIWSFVSPLYQFGILVPLCVWRMRVLDARAVAEGRPAEALDPPPAEALDPPPAELRATVDRELRRLIRVSGWNGAGLLAFGICFVAAAAFLDSTDTPRWVWIPVMLAAGAWMTWLAVRTIPRFRREARRTRDAFATGRAPWHVGHIVKTSAFVPVLEVAADETRYEVSCPWTAPRGVRADGRVLVVGEWQRGAIVLVTGLDAKGRRKGYWGELKPAD